MAFCADPCKAPELESGVLDWIESISAVVAVHRFRSFREGNIPLFQVRFPGRKIVAVVGPVGPRPWIRINSGPFAPIENIRGASD